MVIFSRCQNDSAFREEQRNEFDNCLILAFNNSNFFEAKIYIIF